MRIKFDKQYLKYYTYAVLGVITIILFYKILDNLGFILSAVSHVVGSAFEILLPIIMGQCWPTFCSVPCGGLRKKPLSTLREVRKNQNSSGFWRFWSSMSSRSSW